MQGLNVSRTADKVEVLYKRGLELVFLTRACICIFVILCLALRLS